MGNFGRKIRLRWYFRDSEDFSEVPVFRPRSKFNPSHKDVAIEVYLSKLEDELMKLLVDGKNFSNLTKEELLALNSLKSDRSTVIKEADKGSGVVLWDREDYVKETESQLQDSTVYFKLDNDPSDDLHSVVNQAVGKVRERGDIDYKALKYLIVNNPKLGRFYLLLQIHKGCIVFSENLSFPTLASIQRTFGDFWIDIYNLLLKVSAHTSKTQTTVCKRIASLDRLPEDTILCTIDVVGLCPSIPNDEGLKALRDVLNSRND